MNPQRPNGGGPGDNVQQNALSLLVDAAGSRDPSQHQSLADTLRLRGFTANEPSGAPSLEEQLLLQQQMYGLSGAPNASTSSILSQLQDRNNLLGALGAMGGNQNHQHHQLASLLGLGGADNFRSALAAAHLRQQQQSQQPQFTHADILALARSGQTSLASSLLSGFGGGGHGLGGGPGSGLGGGPGSGLGGSGNGLGGGSGMGGGGGGLGGASNSGLGGAASSLGGSGRGQLGGPGGGLGGSGRGQLGGGQQSGLGGSQSGRGLGGQQSGLGGQGGGLGGPTSGLGGSGRGQLGGQGGGNGLGGAPTNSKNALGGNARGNLGGPTSGNAIGGPANGLGGPAANPPASAGSSGGGAVTGLASELESLQRLEEIERRQRLMATGASPLVQGGAAMARGDSLSAAVKGPVIRDERIPGGHVPRPSMESSQSEKKENNVAADDAVVVPSVAGVATAPGTDSGNKDELEKTPGSVIVPCRARGMPMDHNFKTAYFVIPENVKHGEELICSYFACRNAGIKFRYCSHCKVPVAKRNFRKRHKHGGEEVPPIHGDADDSEGEEQVGGKRGIPSSITAKRSSMDADALSSNSAESQEKEETPEVLVRSSMRNHEEKQESQVSVPAPVASLQPEANSKISNDRMERWATLLGRRPATKEGDMMSAWLMEVLAVSDLDTPLKASEDLGDSKGKSEKADSKVPGNAAVAEKAVAAAAGDTKKAAKESGVSSVVKKKRPAEAAQNDVAASASGTGETFASGSFAAWKERKKQKKQAKMNPTQEAEV